MNHKNLKPRKNCGAFFTLTSLSIPRSSLILNKNWDLPKIIFSFALIICCCFASIAQNNHTVSGTITDSSSNESLIGVNVLIPEINNGQLIKMIRAEYLVDAKGLNLVRGKPISSADIQESVKKIIG